jgi:hypothetical protein
MLLIQDALRIAQDAHPLDLVKRLNYMHAQRDRYHRDQLSWHIWSLAIERTRDGK